VAIAFQGDANDPKAWSGVPAGLSSGLTAAGAEAVAIDARFPGAGRAANALRMSWADATANGFFAAASGVVANRSLRRAGVDAVVAVGSGFVLSTALPTVTFEDMTVAQALHRDDPVYESLSDAQARRWRSRQAQIYTRSRACCATSSWVARSIEQDYGIGAEKIRLVGLGRNTEDEDVAERDWSVPRFLFVGFDWERKRGAAVVEAFTTLRERLPAATLDLVGGHPEIAVDGVTGHGTLPLDSDSGQRQYRSLRESATCFLMPSTYEPFGIAYVDAGAAGVPSIGTTVGGAADAVGDGGRVVDPRDDGALLAAMLELADPQTARHLGALAREHAALFTWRAVGERLLRALRIPGVDVDGLSPFLAAPATTEARS
jgi:glycosyltransferase involved in cell wall biosynthesis